MQVSGNVHTETGSGIQDGAGRKSLEASSGDAYVSTSKH